MTTVDLYDDVAAASPERWAPAADEEVDKARDRYLAALRKACADIAPKVDMKTQQWRGGRGYYLTTLIELTGEEAPQGV
ncbi:MULTISPECIES: hypothetical protein [Streptomyces]|uniref:Uncharacterized protein n=1 Tax=Streptomyces changanensis TaxID=2964669 RepID=A0ABY5NF17_9ACTN|nr:MULTISPECIES: hypothetical protein [Streptomyces]UUS34610.1 hypothetical protein NRO40_29865 [Streptomyces changanensis]